MGFKLENIAPTAQAQKLEKKSQESIWTREIQPFGSTFSNKKKENFYTELGVLLNAGITLKEALELLKEGERKEKQKLFYETLLVALIDGQGFSEVIAKRKEFSEYEYHSLRIGEESGTLPQISSELGSFFSKRNEQRRNLINALTYPVIILITAVLVVIFMLRLVVPMFQDIFKQNGVDLPWITEVVVSASNFLGNYGWWIFGILVLLLIGRKTILKNETFKKYRDQFLLRVPVLGNFIKTVYLAQFTRALSLLTAAKVPMLNSLELASKMIDFYPLRMALQKINQGILKGKSLSECLDENKIFDSKMVSLIKVAEETNKTEFIFSRLNEQYSIEVQQKSKLVSTLLEPIIILIVGILVGVILVAMYLPMFKLGSVLS